MCTSDPQLLDLACEFDVIYKEQCVPAAKATVSMLLRILLIFEHRLLKYLKWTKAIPIINR